MSRQHGLVRCEACTIAESKSGNGKTKKKVNKVKLLEEEKMKFVESRTAHNNEQKGNSKDIETKKKNQMKRGGIESRKGKKGGRDPLSLILNKEINKLSEEEIGEHESNDTSRQTYKRFKTDEESIGYLSMSCAPICYYQDDISIAPLDIQEKNSTKSAIEPSFLEESFQDQDDDFQIEYDSSIY